MRYPHLLTAPLVAIAHGSRDPRAAAAVMDLLALARDRAAIRGLTRLDVRAAFLGHAAPAPVQVIDGLAEELSADDGRRAAGLASPSRRMAEGPGGSLPRTITVLPLLLTAAYHSRTDIPALLRDGPARWPGVEMRYGAPLGPHPGLLRALERRLAEDGVDVTREAGHTAVVLASAGSSRPAANAVIARLAAGWQAARGWRAVVPAYASAARPTPAEAVTTARRDGARRVVVASYLLAPGLFADRIAAAAADGGADAVSAPLGPAPEVADVLLDRYAEALAEPVIPGSSGGPPLTAGHRRPCRLRAAGTTRSRHSLRGW